MEAPHPRYQSESSNSAMARCSQKVSVHDNVIVTPLSRHGTIRYSTNAKEGDVVHLNSNLDIPVQYHGHVATVVTVHKPSAANSYKKSVQLMFGDRRKRYYWDVAEDQKPYRVVRRPTIGNAIIPVAVSGTE